MRLGRQQRHLLMEAKNNYCQHHRGKSVLKYTYVVTYPSEAKACTRTGLMQTKDKEEPRKECRYVLTLKGLHALTQILMEC